jgi:hypothetical protein
MLCELMMAPAIGILVRSANGFGSLPVGRVPVT